MALLWSYSGINRNVEQTLLNMLVISQMMGDKSFKYPNLNVGNNYFIELEYTYSIKVFISERKRIV